MRISIAIPIIVLLIVLSSSCEKDETPPEPVTDISGNIYKTIKIGTQIWMAENLKTTKFNDGTEIPMVTNSATWGSLSSPAYSLYNGNDTSYKRIYGILYNGYAVNTGNICPSAWHVPAYEEFQLLSQFLGDSISGGGKLKEQGTVHWNSPNKGANNISGFTALPGGIRYFEGSFTALLFFTCFWSATEINNEDNYYLSLYYGDAGLKINHASKKHGFSVRCIKD